ncbi:glycosyltransferase family 87 protein [Hyphomonas sp.]|uniref:glycosyltransferase family 87 protein n=1 Tax=Hyphomonas sp. TaxID=87 RepID=UPI00391A6230
MHSLTVNGIHILGALIGFLLIYRLSVPGRFSQLLWPVTALWGAVMALFIFFNTHPLLFADFRDCYWLAGHLIWQGPQALMGAYDAENPIFVNIPIVAYLFAPFGLMPDLTAALVFTGIGVIAVLYTWRKLTELYSLDRRESALLFLALCIFGPMLYSFREANTSHMILAALVAGIALTRERKDLTAGIVFGVCAVIKPALLLIGVFYFLRGRWNVVIGGAAVVVTSALLSLLIFGWDMHVFWYESSIAPFTQHPVPAYSNQTLQAMLARFEIGGPAGHNYSIHELSALSNMIDKLLTVLLVGGALFAVWRSGRMLRATDRDIEIELMMIVTLGLMVSALSWAHYYVWLFPGAVFLWAQSRPGQALERLRWPMLAGFALASGIAFISHSMTLGRFGPFANIVASHWLWGAMIILGLPAIARAQKSAPATAA